MDESMKLFLPWPVFILMWAFLLSCLGGILFSFLRLFQYIKTRKKSQVQATSQTEVMKNEAALFDLQLGNGVLHNRRGHYLDSWGGR